MANKPSILEYLSYMLLGFTIFAVGMAIGVIVLSPHEKTPAVGLILETNGLSASNATSPKPEVSPSDLKSVELRQEIQHSTMNIIVRSLDSVARTLSAFEERITALEKAEKCRCGMPPAGTFYNGIVITTNNLPLLIPPLLVPTNINVITNLSMTNIFFTNHFGTGITPL